jgi:hypothetical protein
MGNYVIGTILHDGKPLTGEISASDVGGEENLKALKEQGVVVDEEPEQPERKGTTENDIPYDPRPGGTVQMETALPEPVNVPEEKPGDPPKTTQPPATKAVTK